MSTETTQDHRDPGLGVLLAAALVALAAGVIVVAVAALAGGRPAALGAAVGAGLVSTVLFTGSFVVHVVSQAMPSASMMVALLTYGLQITVLGATLLSFKRSGALGETLHPEWLTAGLVLATLTWMVAQIWLSARARVLLYDLPEAQQAEHEEAGTR